MIFKPQQLIPILGTPTILVKRMAMKIVAYLVINSMFKYCLLLLKKRKECAGTIKSLRCFVSLCKQTLQLEKCWTP